MNKREAVPNNNSEKVRLLCTNYLVLTQASSQHFVHKESRAAIRMTSVIQTLQKDVCNTCAHKKVLFDCFIVSLCAPRWEWNVWWAVSVIVLWNRGIKQHSGIGFAPFPSKCELSELREMPSQRLRDVCFQKNVQKLFCILTQKVKIWLDLFFPPRLPPAPAFYCQDVVSTTNGDL